MSGMRLIPGDESGGYRADGVWAKDGRLIELANVIKIQEGAPALFIAWMTRAMMRQFEKKPLEGHVMN